jgi:glycosidase
VAENTAVTLRFRTLAGDVESVRLLTVNEATGARNAIPMTLVAIDSEGGYDWWEATVNTGAAPNIHTYTFEIADGDTVLYYIDSALDGGAGNVSATAPAPGIRAAWDIYSYLADFESPDWAKNAVIYQIFPDRFRNGRPENDPTADDWFYPEERGRAFPVEPWNTIVPDPQPNDPGANPEWYATWNSTFYGGDLQGVIEQLDYLQELGVTALYFNPIFEAPSNHRYDGRSFDQVDPRLGIEDDPEASLAVLEELGRAAEERGMRLILDGVPNHLSSDAFIFDRYSRHAGEGACESVDSPTRDWFFFNAAQPEGSGPCAGDTNYEQWAGVYTLPQLDNTNEEVIENWLGPEDGVAVRWLRIPGISGWRIDVVPDVVTLNPDFFRFFRDVVKAEHPDAILYSETWWEPEVRGRVLGDEFDSTMNYRFRNAVLGFLRDGDWEDGDGMIPALTVDQFESALRAIEEDYPPAAWETAMNLISSHDVNRAVRVLDHDGVDYAALEPVNNFEDGRNRLRLAAVLQFTLPGAPTVYYGDEVGLVGFGSDVPRDDPYNRQPYPWPDEAGYEDLPQWRQQQEDLLAHYQFLGQLRGEHSFLRTGAWITLGADNATGLYVYGRKDDTGAAIIAINRGDASATVGLNLTGFVPLAATLIDAATGDEVTTPLNAEVGPMDFAIWLSSPETDLSVPDAPLLISAAAGDGVATLEIDVTDPTVTHLLIYRSPVDGGYELIEQIGVDEPGIVTFTEGDLPNGQPLYYRFSGLRASGMESPLNAPVRLIPRFEIAEAALVAPMQVEHLISAITPTVPLQGRVMVEGVTEDEGAAAGILAELGLIRVEPDIIPNSEDAIWIRGDYVGEADGGDLYAAQVTPDATGTYLYGWRFSSTGGESWIYADISGIVADLPWSAPGQLTVIPSEDSDPPNRPFRISEVFASPTQIVVEWRVSRTADLHHYRVCRRDFTAGEGDPCAREFIVPRESQILTDTAVIVDHLYEYQVQSVDTSFNRSEPSDVITVTAAENFVEVTFLVRVPDFTPAEDLIVIAGDNREVFGGQWNPVQPMIEVEENVWAYTAIVKEGTPLQYKYTRGLWETVEQWDAVAGMANRPTAVVASPEGTMVIDNTATDWGEGEDSTKAIRNWRDPLVTNVTAEDGVITVVFNSAVVPTAALDTVITLADASGAAIPGAVAQTDQITFTFTPTQPLLADSVTVTVFNVATDVAMMRPFEAVIGD